jgi:hypothetical protein
MCRVQSGLRPQDLHLCHSSSLGAKVRSHQVSRLDRDREENDADNQRGGDNVLDEQADRGNRRVARADATRAPSDLNALFAPHILGFVLGMRPCRDGSPPHVYVSLA